ncbi:MAG TPA: JAB domain-containing protein [Ferruginibacter sp.]|nr:JAB domain-containing protein [Ferruginibacter sp.]
MNTQSVLLDSLESDEKAMTNKLESSQDRFVFFLKKWKTKIRNKEEGKLLLLNKNKQLITMYTIEKEHHLNIINPIKIVQLATENKASSIIVAQNRINGEIVPDYSEIEEFREFVSSLDPKGFTITDYIIMSSNGYCSFKDNNFFVDLEIDLSKNREPHNLPTFEPA